MRTIRKGATDQSVVIRIVDSGDGTPETGVVFDTAGIDLWYRREGATKTSITEATLATLDAAHADGGVLHIGDGYYRLDLPDAAVAGGADGVMIGGTVTGMVVIGCYVPLVGFDPQDAVRLGLTALPNAAADAAGGLPVSDAGGLDLDAQRTDVAAILVDTADIQPKIGTPAGASLAADIAVIESQTDDIGVAGAGLTAIGDTRIANLDAAVSTRASQASVDDLPTNAELATSQAAADDATLAAIAALNNLSAAQVNAEVDAAIAEAALATAAALATVDGVADAILADTAAMDARLPSDPADHSLVIAATDAILTAVGDVPTNAELATALGTADDAVLAEVALVKAKTDLIPAAPAAVGDIPTAVENADALLGRSIAGGANGGRTVSSSFRRVRNRVAIAGGTLTVYQEDDTTPDHTAAVTTAAGDPITEVDPA